MSDLGTVVYGQSYYDFQPSEKTRAQIDEEVQKILNAAYDDTKKLLQKNRKQLDVLATTLLEKETLYAHEVYELLGITPREDHRLTETPKDQTPTDTTSEPEPGEPRLKDA